MKRIVFIRIPGTEENAEISFSTTLFIVMNSVSHIRDRRIVMKVGRRHRKKKEGRKHGERIVPFLLHEKCICFIHRVGSRYDGRASPSLSLRVPFNGMSFDMKKMSRWMKLMRDSKCEREREKLIEWK